MVYAIAVRHADAAGEVFRYAATRCRHYAMPRADIARATAPCCHCHFAIIAADEIIAAYADYFDADDYLFASTLRAAMPPYFAITPRCHADAATPLRRRCFRY